MLLCKVRQDSTLCFDTSQLEDVFSSGENEDVEKNEMDVEKNEMEVEKNEIEVEKNEIEAPPWRMKRWMLLLQVFFGPALVSFNWSMKRGLPKMTLEMRVTMMKLRMKMVRMKKKKMRIKKKR